MSELLKYYFCILSASVLLATGFPAGSTAQIYFDTKEDSRLWLEGSSTVHRFDCVARSIQGTAFIEGYEHSEPGAADIGNGQAVSPAFAPGPDGGTRDAAVRTSDAASASADIILTSGNNSNKKNRPMRQNLHVRLKIPVKSFDCQHSRMNRDMYEALKSDVHEYILFRFEDADPLDNNGSVPEALFDDGYQPFRIHGVLTVAGVDRNVTLLVRGRTEEDGRYRIKGHKEISMHDFDVEPPTALRGLIRAHDDLTVFFDLHVTETTRDF